MAKIKGVWVFNDVVSHFYWLASYQMINVTFTSNGERFTSLYWYDVPAGDDTIYHLSYDETLAVAGPFGNLYNWDNDAYKTVDFGSAEQDVSDEFLAWMQENATQQASEGETTPTAESVKTKLQSLLTASNAKTGKSDANLTDAVKTLLEGYGQGGGGECSGNHIIEVDELPEVGVEGAIYSVSTFSDVYAVMGDMKLFLSQAYEGQAIAFETATSTTIPYISGVRYAFYYLTDIPDIYMAEYGLADYATSLGAGLGGLSFKGEIADIANATEDGYYAYKGNQALYRYTNGEYKLLVEKGGLEYTSNGDGTCYVSRLGDYHDKEIFIPSISPSGDTVTAIGDSAFYGRSGLSVVHLPDSVTSIGESAFEWCCGLGSNGLESFTIPSGVTSIGAFAFAYCRSLKDITFEGTVEQWNSKVGKGSYWKKEVLATKITCSDGETNL